MIDHFLYFGECTITGWCFSPTPLKSDGVNVSWDDMTFPIYGKHKMSETTDQISMMIRSGMMMVMYLLC